MMKIITVTRNVRFHRHEAEVTFLADKANHRVDAKAPGQPRIRVQRRKDGLKGFTALVSVSGDEPKMITARSPERAFAKAVNQTWQ